MKYGVLVLVMLLLMVSGAAAMSVEAFSGTKRNPDDSSENWVTKVKSGTPKLIKAGDGDNPALCLSSENASFSIERDLVLDIKKYPYITWRWRANVLPPKGDFRDPSTDDQAAQMVVAFDGRTAVDYIWDTNAPIDAIGEFYIPLVITAKILVVANKNDKLQEWVEVTRDLRKDYRRLFGKEPGNISGVRFQVNSQHTESRAEGCVSQITFHD